MKSKKKSPEKNETLFNNILNIEETPSKIPKTLPSNKLLENLTKSNYKNNLIEEEPKDVKVDTSIPKNDSKMKMDEEKHTAIKPGSIETKTGKKEIILKETTNPPLDMANIKKTIEKAITGVKSDPKTEKKEKNENKFIENSNKENKEEEKEKNVASKISEKHDSLLNSNILEEKKRKSKRVKGKKQGNKCKSSNNYRFSKF